MNITESTKFAIWEEIIREAQEMNRPLQDGEMTVAMFAELTHGLNRSVREHLEKKVKEGKLTKRFTLINGHRTAIYCPASQQSLA